MHAPSPKVNIPMFVPAKKNHKIDPHMSCDGHHIIAIFDHIVKLEMKIIFYCNNSTCLSKSGTTTLLIDCRIRTFCKIFRMVCLYVQFKIYSLGVSELLCSQLPDQDSITEVSTLLPVHHRLGAVRTMNLGIIS